MYDTIIDKKPVKIGNERQEVALVFTRNGPPLHALLLYFGGVDVRSKDL